MELEIEVSLTIMYASMRKPYKERTRVSFAAKHFCSSKERPII